MQHSRWRSVRFWLKLSALAVTLTFVGITVFFILRIERIILAQLPTEIQVNRLSVSFLNRSFILNGVKIFGRENSPCQGRQILEITELRGSFLLRERRLNSLTIEKAELAPQGAQRECFVRDPSLTSWKLSDYVANTGLGIELREVRFRLPHLGLGALSGNIKLTEVEQNLLELKSAQLVIDGVRFQVDVRKLAMLARLANGKPILNSANFAAFIKIKDLEKIPQLSSKRLSVLSGSAEIRLTASASRNEWKLITNVELSKVRLRGEPFYRMPMGILQFTPENVWPMVEDSPGIFAFSFETRAPQSKLAENFVADLRNALTHKAKKNLKKKIPILPF